MFLVQGKAGTPFSKRKVNFLTSPLGFFRMGDVKVIAKPFHLKQLQVDRVSDFATKVSLTAGRSRISLFGMVLSRTESNETHQKNRTFFGNQILFLKVIFFLLCIRTTYICNLKVMIQMFLLILLLQIIYIQKVWVI